MVEAGHAAASGLRSRMMACLAQVKLLGGKAPLGKIAFLEWTGEYGVDRQVWSGQASMECGQASMEWTGEYGVWTGEYKP